ncbi:Uncharacterised protein [Weissella viridescens]|uniref:Uncharacterized protein n=1 Tax=Weissella viridescens TaxID=1629 RepID=A0A380NYI2_WEIVI|nr:Uncharacterised protein [Weissella viridescens]
MFKAGKQWLVAGTATVSGAAGGMLLGEPVRLLIQLIQRLFKLMIKAFWLTQILRRFQPQTQQQQRKT